MWSSFHAKKQDEFKTFHQHKKPLISLVANVYVVFDLIRYDEWKKSSINVRLFGDIFFPMLWLETVLKEIIDPFTYTIQNLCNRLREIIILLYSIIDLLQWF